MRQPFKACTMAVGLLAAPNTGASAATVEQYVAIPRSYAESPGAPAITVTPTGTAWWSIFHDPCLDALIERGINYNATIAIASARVSQARADLRRARADRSPELGLAAGASQQGGPLINAAGANGTLITASVGLSWEFDLLGRASRAQRAAGLDVDASEDGLRATQLIVQADIADHYFTLRGLDAEAALLDDAVSAARETVGIAERRLRSGLGNELALAQLRVELSTIEADTIRVAQERAAYRHALTYLTGLASSELCLPSSALLPLPEIPAGLPSAMIARRPDVAAALHAIDAARLRVGIARAAWFPAFGLTASGGVASPSLADIVRTSAQSFGIGLLFSLPVFDGGRHQARVRRSKADLELAAAQYRDTVLRALRETEDGLIGVQSAAAQSLIVDRSLAAAMRARDIVEASNRNGMISRLELLDVRRTALRDQRRATELHYSRYVATVGLIRALGGGWNS